MVGRGIWTPTEGYSKVAPLFGGPDKNPDVTTQDIFAMLGGEMEPRDIQARRNREKHEANVKHFRANVAAYFALVNTRRLIQMLRHAHLGEVWIDAVPGFPSIGDYYFSNEEEQLLRAELAKRPHIPNKKEGRLIRQANAKARHGQAKGRNR